MQNSRLLHSFLETVQLHFKTTTYNYNTKISTIEKIPTTQVKMTDGQISKSHNK